MVAAIAAAPTDTEESVTGAAATPEDIRLDAQAADDPEEVADVLAAVVIPAVEADMQAVVVDMAAADTANRKHPRSTITPHEKKGPGTTPGPFFVPASSNQNLVRIIYLNLVAPPGLEPGLSALKGPRVNQLHHGAKHTTTSYFTNYMPSAS
jgi:hypothetical protein